MCQKGDLPGGSTYQCIGFKHMNDAWCNLENRTKATKITRPFDQEQETVYILRVGQNHLYTVYLRYWQENYQRWSTEQKS